MSRDDDLPDYLRGVEQPFGDDDSYTLRPDLDGPLGASGGFPSSPPLADLDDLDDDDDDTPSAGAMALQRLALVAVLGAVLLLAVGVLGGALVAMGASQVNAAEAANLVARDALIQVVADNRAIISELGARGGNRVELERLYADFEQGQGHEAGALALAFTVAVEQQMVAVGGLRGTPVKERQLHLDRAQRMYEESLVGWQTSAGNPLGQLAVGAGFAKAPPPIDAR